MSTFATQTARHLGYLVGLLAMVALSPVLTRRQLDRLADWIEAL